MNTHNVRSQEIYGLTQHARLSFDTSHTPAHHTETIDHGGMRIRSDKRVRVIDITCVQDTLGKVFKVDLMDDADSRRHDFESIESLHAPFEKLITFTVASEFLVKITIHRIRTSRKINLNRMIDHKIDRN